MQRKGFTLLPWLAAVLVWSVLGCQPRESTGSVQFVGRLQQALSASDVTRVAVMVTGSGMAPLTLELAKTDGTWSGTLARIPAGTDRTFTAEAFGANGTKLYAGSATGVPIVAGKTALVALALQEVAVRPPFENAVPIIDALVSSASSADSGETVTLRATAHDPNPADVLTYAWTASAGVLGSASSATTTWTAPEASGPVTLTLTVADPHGASSTLSLSLRGRGGGRGNADIEVSLNTWPQVARILATPSRVNVGEPTTVVASASDADGDALAYQWSASGCTGSFVDATSATARFTPDAVPPGGSCACRLGVTVRDGHGGQAQGTLAICVGAPTVPRFAPEFVEFFQSSATAGAGGTVTLRVVAEDPQGSGLDFSWEASTGTVGTPTGNGTTSEVVWKAPACVSGGSASIVATVRNALGLSTSTPFTVVGLPRCVRASGWTAVGSMNRSRVYHTATELPFGGVLLVGGDGPPGNVDEVFDPETGWSTLVAPGLGGGRIQHTATTLPSGKVLVVGGYSNSADLFDPVSWTWVPTGSMAVFRMAHTATLLPSGKVLVAGGGSSTTSLETTELYDPATGAWTPAASMAAARRHHTATLLPSGKVLVTGGEDRAGLPFAAAEVYDPATGTWSPVAPMWAPRTRHTATLLPSGKVLATGGGVESQGSPLQSAEVYDPAEGTWSPVAPMWAPHTAHTATLLPSGKVLVVGATLAEVFDPDRGTWARLRDLTGLHGGHTATLLASGKVLLARHAAEVYDPATGAWTSFDMESSHRAGAPATLLPSGKVLVVGGGLGVNAELYDPVSSSWSTTGSLSTDCQPDVATLLPSGKVLVVGGSSSTGPRSTAEVYDPATGTWSPTDSLSVPRADPLVLLLPTGKVLVLGGGSPLMEEYDPGTGTWSSPGSMPANRRQFTATLLTSGKVLIAGGVDSNTDSTGDVASTHLFDPATGTWSTTGTMTSPRWNHTATLLTSGKVLVVGGHFRGILQHSEVYDPETGTWAPTGTMSQPRDRHRATLLASGKVLVVGGIDWAPVMLTELYDPVTGSWAPAGEIGGYAYYEHHTATLLRSGQVMVTGSAHNHSAGTLLYDP